MAICIACLGSILDLLVSTQNSSQSAILGSDSFLPMVHVPLGQRTTSVRIKLYAPLLVGHEVDRLAQLFHVLNHVLGSTALPVPEDQGQISSVTHFSITYEASTFT